VWGPTSAQQREQCVAVGFEALTAVPEMPQEEIFRYVRFVYCKKKKTKTFHPKVCFELT
jgi:hypothetical protein